MSEKDCLEENAELREALAAETEVLKRVQEIAAEGLAPDTDAEETLKRLWEETGDALDPPTPTGAEVRDYCFSLTVDGNEQPTRSQPFADRAAAIAHGRALLLMTARMVHPPTASCAVFESSGTDAEPLGVWDYCRAEAEARWTAER